MPKISEPLVQESPLKLKLLLCRAENKIMNLSTPEKNAELLKQWEDTRYGFGGGSSLDKLTRLRGVVAIETDEAAARIPVLHGKTVSIGSRVRHSHRKGASGTVTGYQIHPERIYNWVSIIVQPDKGAATYADNRWAWDDTVLVEGLDPIRDYDYTTVEPVEPGRYTLKGLSEADRKDYPGKTCAYHEGDRRWLCTQDEARALIQGM